MTKIDAAFVREATPAQDVARRAWHRPTFRVVLARDAKVGAAAHHVDAGDSMS